MHFRIQAKICADKRQWEIQSYSWLPYDSTNPMGTIPWADWLLGRGLLESLPGWRWMWSATPLGRIESQPGSLARACSKREALCFCPTRTLRQYVETVDQISLTHWNNLDLPWDWLSFYYCIYWPRFGIRMKVSISWIQGQVRVNVLSKYWFVNLIVPPDILRIAHRFYWATVEIFCSASRFAKHRDR